MMIGLKPQQGPRYKTWKSCNVKFLYMSSTVKWMFVFFTRNQPIWLEPPLKRRRTIRSLNSPTLCCKCCELVVSAYKQTLKPWISSNIIKQEIIFKDFKVSKATFWNFLWLYWKFFLLAPEHLLGSQNERIQDPYDIRLPRASMNGFTEAPSRRTILLALCHTG